MDGKKGPSPRQRIQKAWWWIPIMALKRSQKSLKKWTKQDWGYITKGDSKKPRRKRGRYLPASVRNSLTASQKAYENRKKRAANRKGKAKAKYTKRVAKRVRRAR